MLAALAERRPVDCRVAIVVAHPDDETLAAGARLRCMPGLLLVHVTDGAPRRLADQQARGFATPADYAAAREQELQVALGLAGVAPDRLRLGVPDQDASLHMAAIAGRLRDAFARFGVEAVLTHCYEGGHPDHDAVAWAVHAAAGDRPLFEFAGYHAGPDREMTVQRFLPGPPETRIALCRADQSHKRAMLDCFVTQTEILAGFGVAVERYRPAPRYDFAAPPHPGPLNYENWGWDMTGTRWRALAAEGLRCAA